MRPAQAAASPVADDVRRALETLGVAIDATLRATPVASVTNRSWRVELRGEAFALRLPAPVDSTALPRALELDHTRGASEVGLAPAVVAADPASGILLSRWVDGSRPVEPAAPGTVERVGALLGRLHRSSLQLGWRFRGIEVAQRQLRLIPRSDPAADLVASLEPAQTALLRRLGADLARPRPAHNDPNPGNILDDGQRLWLIDWEYSGLNDPFWDLAAFAEEAVLDPAVEQRLLAAWGDPGAAAQDRLRAQRRCCRWIAGLWYLGQAALRRDPSLRVAGRERLEALAREP